MKNKRLAADIERCLGKRHMSYKEARAHLLKFDKYEHQEVIFMLQQEYVKHKTKTSRFSMFAGLFMLTVIPLVQWGFGHNATGYQIDYKPIIFGLVIMASSFVSFQRAKAAARRFEEFT